MEGLKNLQYFRSIKGRGGGRKPQEVISVHAVRSDGTIKAVDTTRNTIRVNVSFGSQGIGKLEIISKYEFEKELEKVIEYKKNV